MTWWQHTTTNPDDSSYETFSTDEVIASTKGLEQVSFQTSADYDKPKDLEITPQTDSTVARTGGWRILILPTDLSEPYQTDYKATKELQAGPDIIIYKNGDLVDSYSTNASIEKASSELIAYFADKGFDITYLGTERPDIFKIGSGDSNGFYIEEQGNGIFSFYIDNNTDDRGYQGTMRGGGGADLFEVDNIEGEFLVNGNQGEDFITGIGNIVYRGGQDNDLIAVSQGEVYGDKGADTFVGVKGDGYAVIQDYTIGEDIVELAMDGEWNNVGSGLMFTDISGDEIMLLVGINDVQQVETIDESSIGGGGWISVDNDDEFSGNTGSSIGGGGGRNGSTSIGDGGGWLL